jgi:hypothetical protein
MLDPWTADTAKDRFLDRFRALEAARAVTESG